jgi:hypothetical protein
MGSQSKVVAQPSGRSRPRAVLVGEDNPYSQDPRYALYPYPANSAGHRLQSKIMGVSLGDYLAMGRENLCWGGWSASAAKDGAARVLGAYPADVPVVLLGAKVAAAFCLARPWPFTWRHQSMSHMGGAPRRVVFLPHPSGRCRVWNDPSSYEMARDVLREVGVLA